MISCSFCAIVTGKVSAITVYSDDDCIVIMDVVPTGIGQMVVIPREHSLAFGACGSQVEKCVNALEKGGFARNSVTVVSTIPVNSNDQHRVHTVTPATSREVNLLGSAISWEELKTVCACLGRFF